MSNQNSKTLILLTGGFPYGTGETFLETEIKYLCEGFEQVKILAVDPLDVQLRPVPQNCNVSIIRTKRDAEQKLRALTGILEPRVKVEIRIIKEEYGMTMNKGILSTLLMSLQRAKTIEKQILPHINEDENNILYSYWCDDSALALALLSEKRKALKTVCRIHRWDVYFDQSPIGYLPFRHFIYRNLRNIFSISEDGIRYASEIWKVDPSKFILSRLGIEAQEPMNERTDGVFTIVSCSNLIPVKRVHLIAEVIKELDGKFPLRWIHIGDGPERKRVESIISGISEQTQVVLKGRLSNTEVFELYREMVPDLFVNLSSSEGIPVSIMEAMSIGIPVIATDVGGNAEIVNECNGILLEANPNIESFSEALESLINCDKIRFNSKREGALSMWENEYDAELNYQKFVENLNLLK
jgi:glycosyltransferase involved in cell wall biosynthesis